MCRRHPRRWCLDCSDKTEPTPPSCTTMARQLIVALALIGSAASQPTLGPYKTSMKILPNLALDATNQHVLMVFPEAAKNADADGALFPLLAYAHGAAGGGYLDINGYDAFFHQLASWGFVVAAHMSCNIGCKEPGGANAWTECAGVPLTKPAPDWGPYYAETLKTIEWARNETAAQSDEVFGLIDWAKGVGIAGHSMGGQATTLAASAACAAKYDIRAAAVHHPEDATLVGQGVNAGSMVGVPFAAFTSTGDETCSDADTKEIYDALPPGLTGGKLFRDLVGWSHLEPVLVSTPSKDIENPLLATYTAAWMGVFLNLEGPGTLAYDLIFGGGGNGTVALCESQPMAECEVVKL